MTVELVSFSKLKEYMGLTQAAITDYPSLSVVRDSVVYAIERYLKRYIENTLRTETIFIIGPTAMISLKGLPISTVSSVTVTIDGESETYTSDDYNITGFGLQLYSQISNARVVVVYTGGLSTIPAEIERAALIQTAYEFQTKDNVGASSVYNDGGSVTTPELGLLKETQRMLNGYKHPLAWC